jgi:hypothetical protein
MSVNINTFKLFVEFIANKVQIGGTVSPSQFNLLANQAQLQLFEKDRNVFLQTGESTLFMDFFFKNLTTSVPPTGTLAYPSNFLETTSMRGYYVPPSTGIGIEVPIEEIENSEYGKITASQLMLPTKEFPKFSDFDVVIRLLPKDIGIIMWDYWREPVKPIWGFTVVSGRPVYNPLTSTDFEWTENFINEVAALYLSFIGVNLKDGELAGFANQFKNENNVNG